MMLAYSRLICVALGLVAGVLVLWRRRSRFGIDSPVLFVFLCVSFSALSVFSAVLFAKFEAALGGGPAGAVSVYGCYFVCPALLYVLFCVLRLDLRKSFDLYALFAVPSLFLLRVNCVLSGCCIGRPILDTVYRWPVREAELLFYCILYPFMLRLSDSREDTAPGTLFPLLLGSYGCFRFVNEFFRVSSGSGLFHIAHLWSVAAAVIGLFLYVKWSDSLKSSDSVE